MAAKPPKPPATFLKQSSHNNNNDFANDNNGNSSNISNPSTSAAPAVSTPTTPTSTATHSASAETYSKLGIKRYNSRENLLNNITNDYNYNENDTETIGNSLEGAVAAAAAARPACNCTNISIMHLFHEMKQEFPTIPDPIVAQCVNDNCHQRENCIQMLRNELALNPIPVQTYPAKVLQQHHINNQQHSNLQQQKQLQQRQKSPQQPAQTQPAPQPPQRHKNALPQKPATPLRPIRAAPTQPPTVATLQRVRAEVKNSAVTPQTNCDSVELVQNSSNLSKDVNSAQLPCNNQSNNSSNNNNSGVSDSPKQACDMPVTATASANASVECVRSSDFISALNRIAANHQPSAAQLPAVGARTRPNTLNLQASQQQLQRQQLNKQLQQHLQQRSQLKQQQQQLASGVAEEPPQQRPIRKAPLPPIAPKPVFHNNISYNSNSNHNNNNNNNSCGNSPQSQSVGSYSTESALTSPLSSCGESELSGHVSCAPMQAFALSHINRQNNNNNNNNVGVAAAIAPTSQPQPISPLRSPIRHRSVITVQPEPPYARDFLPSTKINTVANPATGGSGGSTPTSQKSFTSVNLTLRQPTNTVPQSTIDISAGPAVSGNGSGLTYSSTSYNARHGFQQNFHITVTEEGGVFNASRIRPRNSGYYAGIEGANTPDGPAGGAGQTTPTKQQQSQTSTAILRSPTTQATQNFTPQAQLTTASSEDMCLPLENSGELVKC